jgi:hypothetical protein
MSCCPECGQLFSGRTEICPSCASRLAQGEFDVPGEVELAEDRGAADGARQVAIARFQSGAEAGFFADELCRETGVAAEVLARERFDAVHAVWSVDYILLVDRPQAECSARALAALVEATGGECGDDANDESRVSDLPVGVWVPLILTLAAGSIACFGIERLDHRPRPAALVVGDRREPPELWEVLTATRGTWVQQLEGGIGTRELTLDRDRHRARLREDHDGDGRFDREWDFSWKKR